MITDHVVLLVFMLITLVIVVSGFAFMISALREMQRITRVVGMLVIQETAKLPGKSG